MQLSEMRSRLRKRIGNPDTTDVPDTELTRFINQAYEDIADRFRFHQVRKLCTFDTISGTSRYGLPSDCKTVMRVRDHTTGRKLRKGDDQDEAFQEGEDNEVSGVPLHYIRQRNWIKLDPTPDAVYTIELFYKSTMTALATDGSSPELPDAWHEGILKLARHYFYDETGDVPKAQYALAIFNSWLSTKPVEVDEEKSDLDKGVRIPSLATGRRGVSQEDFDRGGSGYM